MAPPSDASPGAPHEPRTNAPAGAHDDADGVPPEPIAGTGVVARYPWAVFIVPYVLFVALSALEPKPGESLAMFGWTVPAIGYPAVYCAKLVVVMISMIWLRAGYRQFAWKLSPLALVVGVVGAAVWIGLCKLELERFAAELPGGKQIFDYGQRSGFDPLAYFAAQPLAAYAFLAVRFWGLVVIVPVIEEFFLRGFVMRYFIDDAWWKVPFGTLTRAALVAGTLVPIVTHPMTELLAVVTWFSMVTWLMWRTRNMWDCVVAHMTTNLLLGIWVVARGDWYLM